jgi:hypothetical protein
MSLFQDIWRIFGPKTSDIFSHAMTNPYFIKTSDIRESLIQDMGVSVPFYGWDDFMDGTLSRQLVGLLRREPAAPQVELQPQLGTPPLSVALAPGLPTRRRGTCCL